jgi:hypothetical protein
LTDGCNGRTVDTAPRPVGRLPDAVNVKEAAMRSPRVLLFAATMIGAATLGVGMANAEPLEREHYSGTETFSFDDCGFTIDGEVTFSGLFMLKEGKRGDPTPYVFDNYQYETVYTNAETGAWFTQSGNGLFKDLKIVNISGTIYTFETVENGRPFEIRDSDGNLIIKDRGHLRTRFMVDTLGDTDLDNDVFIEGSFELLAESGSHPGFFIDFCHIATDLIG